MFFVFFSFYFIFQMEKTLHKFSLTSPACSKKKIESILPDTAWTARRQQLTRSSPRFIRKAISTRQPTCKSVLCTLIGYYAYKMLSSISKNNTRMVDRLEQPKPQTRYIHLITLYAGYIITM